VLDGFLNMPPLKNAIYFFAVDNKIPKVGGEQKMFAEESF
jgi:hypothetical protein